MTQPFFSDAYSDWACKMTLFIIGSCKIKPRSRPQIVITAQNLPDKAVVVAGGSTNPDVFAA